jgi:DNA-binding PadR family transcriptional regulator
MAQAKRRSTRQGVTSLKTAVLAALVEHPGHGYGIAGRLSMRMGPAWQVESKRVYEVLQELEDEGMASSVRELSSEEGRLRRVYTATPLAEQERARWMGERQPVPLVRADIHARVAFSRPEEAPQLLKALDEYELDCMEMLEQHVEADFRPAAWRGRVLNLMRVAPREHLEGEIRWIMRARREIEEYLAEAR